MKLMMFDFSCGYCGEVTEHLVKPDTSTVKCPYCGRDATRSISAPAAFKFNGSGFYETDFKGKK